MESIIRKVSVMLIGAVLLTLNASITSAHAEDDPAVNRARPDEQAQTALTRYISATVCENSDVAFIRDTLEDLEKMVRIITELGEPSLREAEDRSRARHTALAFGYADVALAKGCLDDADEVYRRLIMFYIGSSYAGIRDRARIGVDDVRAERLLRK